METLHGVVENYAQIEELLSDAEMKGRRWVFDRAHSGATTEARRPITTSWTCTA